MVTQRPPEISGSKNALAGPNRGRNTSLITGAGGTGITEPHSGKQITGKYNNSLMSNKNQSAMAFQSQASAVSGYDSQLSVGMGLPPDTNFVNSDHHVIQAGFGFIGANPSAGAATM